MNASELEHLWQKQQPFEPSPENIAQIAATVDTLDRKFQRKIWWRDLREIAAAIIVATFFGLVGHTWLRWIAVASVLFVAAWIFRSRILVRPGRKIPNVIERLHQMIYETEMQIGMQRSVLWWYLLPCTVAIFAIVLDSSPRNFNSPFLWIFGSVTGAMYVGLYWLNQRVVRKKLLPRRENLRHAIAELSRSS
jgi:hypothetical protein